MMGETHCDAPSTILCAQLIHLICKLTLNLSATVCHQSNTYLLGITRKRPCKLQLLVANGQRCEEGLKALNVSH